MIAGSAGYFVHAWNVDGVEPKGFPKFTGGWALATPTVGDLDGDGKLELVAGDAQRLALRVAHRAARPRGASTGPSFHHDTQNTGNFATKLDQGKPASPGGCQCQIATGAGNNSPPVGVIVIAALALASIYARSRRQRG